MILNHQDPQRCQVNKTREEENEGKVKLSSFKMRPAEEKVVIMQLLVPPAMASRAYITEQLNLSVRYPFGASGS